MRARQPSVPKTMFTLVLPYGRRRTATAVSRLGSLVRQREQAPAGHSRSPVIERIAERVGERDAGRPTGLLAKTRGVESDAGGLAPADARRVELGPDRDAGEGDERVEDLRDRHRMPRPDVERAALAETERRRVRACHVADVQEVTLRVEAAVPDNGLGEARLSLGDLLRERRRRETGVLSRAVLVCGPQDDDGCPVPRSELARERF